MIEKKNYHFATPKPERELDGKKKYNALIKSNIFGKKRNTIASSIRTPSNMSALLGGKSLFLP